MLDGILVASSIGFNYRSDGATRMHINESFLLKASLLWEVYLTQVEGARLHLERKTEAGCGSSNRGWRLKEPFS